MAPRRSAAKNTPTKMTEEINEEDLLHDDNDGPNDAPSNSSNSTNNSNLPHSLNSTSLFVDIPEFCEAVNAASRTRTDYR